MRRTLDRDTKVIGVISDTHGLIRPEAIAALHRVDLILHAGDIGDPEVIERLKRIAAVIAVRGNNDKAEWAEKFSESEIIEVGSVAIYLLHDLKQIDLDPSEAGFRVVVSGHSHKPLIEERQGVLFLNPGSAGPRRFHLPVSVARLRISGDRVRAELTELAVSRSVPAQKNNSKR